MSKALKNTMPKALAIILVLTMAFSSSFIVFATDDNIIASGTQGGIEWSLNSNGELRLDGSGKWNATNWKKYIGSVKTIFIGKNITGDDFFDLYVNVASGYSSLEAVSVEAGNTFFSVDSNGVLYNYNKTKLFMFPINAEISTYEIPDSVKTIAAGAFCGGTKLTTVTGGNNVEVIDTNAFYCCSGLKSIELSNTVKTIGNSAFFKCTSLTGIAIPDSVESIGTSAFDGCESIVSVTLGKSLISIGTYAFRNCDSIEKVNYIGTLESWCGISFANDTSNPVSFTKNLYINDTEVSEIAIPNTVTEIKNYAFYSMENLSTATLPDTVTTIGKYAFADCGNLEKINIPDSITTINANAFENCVKLESISLGKNLVTLGAEAFRGCKKLSLITIYDKLTAISNSTFYECEALKSVTLGKGVSAIGSTAFAGCTSLKNINLDDSITNIGSKAFINCTSLESVIVPEKVTSVASGVFSGCTSLSSVVIGNNVTEIGDDAFKYCVSLDSIVIPDSVTAIGDNAFRNCTNLTDITISKNLTSIGKYAFYKTGFYNTYSNWDNGFLYMGTYLLETNENELNENCIIYPKTTIIAGGAFINNSNIVSIAMYDNVRYINESAFSSCVSLKTVKLSQSLINIDDHAFSNCLSLEMPIMPDSLRKIGSFAFQKCLHFENLVLNEGLKSIGSYAFSYIPNLTEVSLPASMTSLASDAFASSGITDIYYGSSKADWKDLAKGNKFNNATVQYTLKNDDETIIINHTDNSFEWSSGNIHLITREITPASPTYDRGGYYNTNMLNPIQVFNIAIADGDGNFIQPCEDGVITVKIKATEEFEKLMCEGLNQLGDYNGVSASDINYADGCFIFEQNGERISVSAADEFLNSFKVVHWFTDGTTVKDRESFDHTELKVEKGYIIMQTNHFSDYAVCVDLVKFENSEIQIINGEKKELAIVTADESIVKYSSSDESIATVDENGVVTAQKPGEVTITATLDRTGITAECKVSVLPRGFTLTWIVDGNKTEEKVYEGSEIVKPENPVKNGYIFKGWTPEVPDIMPSGNKEFTAVFEEITVEKLKLDSKPAKLAYTYKIDSLDLNGMKLTAEMTDGTLKDVDFDDITVSGYDSKKTGAQTITVEYEEKTVEFEITVERTWWQWLITIFLFGWIWY